MDQCVTEVPPLRQVAGATSTPGGHRSACWLPVDEVGLGAEVDAQREQVSRARRTTATGRPGASRPRAPAPAAPHRSKGLS